MMALYSLQCRAVFVVGRVRPPVPPKAQRRDVFRPDRKSFRKFLRLMREQPVLCQQATDMLSREVSFIQAAVTERMQALVSAK